MGDGSDAPAETAADERDLAAGVVDLDDLDHGDDRGDDDGDDGDDADDDEVIERAKLNDSEEGREIAAGFVKLFADYFATSVRPLLVQVAEDGRHPQLLVNGLAELMRTTADRIEFPLDHPRAGAPKDAPQVPT